MKTIALSRRTFTSAAALVAASIAAPALRAQGKLEKTKVAIAVGGKAAFYYLPLTISEQLGYFKSEGLDVEISDFAGGSKALQALVGGSADVVSGAYEHTINMQSKNQWIQAIARISERWPLEHFEIRGANLERIFFELYGEKVEEAKA